MKRLFIDDAAITERSGLIRLFHPVEKLPANPILLADLPWERAVGHNHGTAILEDGRFRFWYQTFTYAGDGHGTFHCAYAESADGIHWDKPELGLVELAGSRANNLVAYDIGGINIIVDAHEPDPERRYKMLYYGSGTSKKEGSLQNWMGSAGNWGWCAAWSADGLRWTPHPDNPVYTGAGDDGSFLGWDETLGGYAAYLRPIGLAHPGSNPDDPLLHRFPRHRLIGLTASRDLAAWAPTRAVIAPEPEEPRATQFYSMPVFRYEDWYLGLAYILYCDPDEPGSLNHRGLMDIQLAASRDGLSWKRLGGPRAFIPRGEPGSFDQGMVGPNNGLTIKDGKLWFFYNGWSGEHYETKAYRRANDPGLFAMGRLCSGIGLGTLRLDGFVSLEAGEEEGTLVTTPENLPGGELFINAVTEGPAGTVVAEVLNSRGEPVRAFSAAACEPFRGDSVSHRLRWRGPPEGLPRGEHRLRFRLRRARLYSYSVGSPAT